MKVWIYSVSEGEEEEKGVDSINIKAGRCFWKLRRRTESQVVPICLTCRYSLKGTL